MIRYYEVRCPGKRKHKRRSGDNLVVEDNCAMLLTMIGEDIESVDEVIHCRNCKSLIHIGKNRDVIELELLPKGTKVETIDGSYTVDEY